MEDKVRIKMTRLAIVFFCLTACSLDAGTVITNNLPPGTAIVNIDARVDGAAGFNGDQSLWYRPFNVSGGPLLQLPVSSGDYTFRVIDPADAAALYPNLTSAQTNQIFTGWTYNSPWIENYLVFDISASTNASVPQLFDGDPEWPPFSNAQDVYNASVAHGTYNQIRTGPLGRASTIRTNVYSLPQTTSLIFVVPDYGLYDNGGGVSVVIAPAQPTLSITLTNGQAKIVWPTSAAGFNLYETDDLSSSNWSQVTTSFQVDQSNYWVALPIQGSQRFYRLSK